MMEFQVAGNDGALPEISLESEEVIIARRRRTGEEFVGDALVAAALRELREGAVSPGFGFCRLAGQIPGQ